MKSCCKLLWKNKNEENQKLNSCRSVKIDSIDDELFLSNFYVKIMANPFWDCVLQNNNWEDRFFITKRLIGISIKWCSL